MATRTTAIVLAALVALAACGTIGTIVSSGPGTVAVQVPSSDDLPDANARASEYCDERDGRASLERTEAVGQGLVAYFNCV